MRIRRPDGREIEAEDIDFDTIKEDWNEYKLEDGSTLKIKLIVTGIIRTSNHDPMTGDPVYQVKSTNVVRVVVPEELKRLPSPKESSGEEIV
jgi:hypothetical protein